MGILYFRKSGASVLRVLEKSIAQVSLPGYTKTLLVDFQDPSHVGPESLTTLKAATGARGDLYLTPTYLFAHGIVPDTDFVKWPDSKGGSYGELWRSWSHFQSHDPSGSVAESLCAIRTEVRDGTLAACASDFAAGDLDRARAGLNGLVNSDAKAARSARALLAPGYRSDSRRVVSVLQAAVLGILAEAC